MLYNNNIYKVSERNKLYKKKRIKKIKEMLIWVKYISNRH